MKKHLFFALIVSVFFSISVFGNPVLPTQQAANYCGGVIVVIEDVPYCVGFAPNPSTDDNIHCYALETGNQITEIRLSDHDGHLLLSQSCNAESCDLDVSSLASGDYVLEVKTENCINHRQVQVIR